MRNTNSKEVRIAVKNYLEAETEMSAFEIQELFAREYGYMIPRIGLMPACLKWLQGCSISIAFSTYEITRILADWLDDSVESQEQWVEKRGDGLYWLLIAKEILYAKKGKG